MSDNKILEENTIICTNRVVTYMTESHCIVLKYNMCVWPAQGGKEGKWEGKKGATENKLNRASESSCYST